jgi:hypothetical protein
MPSDLARDGDLLDTALRLDSLLTWANGVAGRICRYV